MCHRSLPPSCLWTLPVFMWHSIKVSFSSINLKWINYFFRYFIIMLVYFSLEPFYTDNIHLPHDHDPVLPEILKNPKIYLFFKDTLGTIDGTHINWNSTAEDWQAAHNHKGSLTQNCLAICSFDMRFLYIFGSWEGAASDSTMFEDVHITDLPILHAKYYLVDAGFPICDSLIVPYQGEHYHLAGWGCAQLWYVSASSYSIFQLTVILAPPIRMNYSTSDMHLHTTLSSVYLVSWNSTSRFCYTHLKSTWLFRHVCLLPLQHCTTSFVTSIPLISMTFKRLCCAGNLAIWQMGLHSGLRGIGQITGTER